MSLLVDRRGWLWLGTDIGLVVWNGASWRHFTEESGLIWNDASRGVLREAIDGSIWIGTSTGTGHLLHPETAFDHLPLSVVITSIKHNNWSLPPAEIAAMPWGATPISFRFASPDAFNRSGLSFSYRLGGLESYWITTQDTDATFSGLPPGTFRFEILAYNADTGTTSPVAASTFSILPPWWKTFWFYYACAVAAVALVWFMLWLRTRHLMRNQHKLEALIQERTRELQESREAFRIQATHDGLTGLLNRAAVLDRLGPEINRLHREGISLAVVMADIDHFKSINDTHGHPAGDAVLRQFAFYLGQCIRPYDHVGRYGGEEFLLVLANIVPDDVDDRLLTLHSSLSNLTVHFEEKLISLNCSMGACLLQPSDQNTDASQLLSSVDGALYQAKRGGRNRLVQAHKLDPARSEVSL